MGQVFSHVGGWGIHWKHYFWKDVEVPNEFPVITKDHKDTSKLHMPLGTRIRKPDYYRVENIPELQIIKDRLAARNLKSPWLRNEVWRFERKYWGTPADRTFFMLGYAKYGAIMFACCWIYLEVIKGGSPPHHHHHYYEDYTKSHGVHGDKYSLLNESKLLHGAKAAHH